MVPPPILKRLSLWLAGASAVSILLSIAVSQILLAVALVVLLLSGLPLRWPRISIPLALFLAWTLVALAFSPDPAFGFPAVRKMIVFLTLMVVYSSVRLVRDAKWLAFAWIAAGAVTAALGLMQFARDVAGAQAAHEPFYNFYIADRIRGFMSHWMTFSGQELFVLLLAIAFALFAREVRRWLWFWAPALIVIGSALVLSDTRSVWMAAVAGTFYLLWVWDKRAALAMPVLLALALTVAPVPIRQRVRSITHPTRQTDSNAQRIIVWRTGLAMIRAHPLTGVGPEEIRKPEVFYEYLPKDIPVPLPDGYYGHLHSIYIHYAAECGLPATIFLTAAFVVGFIDFRRGLLALPKGRSDRRFLLHGAVASVIGAMVAGVFEKNLGDTEVLTMFLAICCIGYVAAESDGVLPNERRRKLAGPA